MLALAHLAEHDGLTPSRIGALLDLSSGGITALLQRLERDGHVGRHPHPTDRRSYLIRLTPETLTRGASALAPLARDLDALVAARVPADRALILTFIADVARVSEEHAARAWSELDETDEPPPRPVPSLWA